MPGARSPAKKPKPTSKRVPAARKAVEKAKPKERARAPAPRARSKGVAQAAQVAERLALAIPEPACELRFGSAFELLIATVLSAQSTDRTVNAVMPALLARFPTPAALAAAPQEAVEELVKRTGFFRNKAKAVRGVAAKLVAEHGGEVPRSIAELVTLPGVARKTANVVLGTAYGIAEGFVVDTHVTRVAQRLGLTRESDPVRIEQDLCRRYPRESWVDLGHRLVLHGRYTCVARRPLCAACPLNELCPSRLEPAIGEVEQRAARQSEVVGAALTAN